MLELTELPWGSDYYLEHGRMMPGDALDLLRGFDAIYLGAVGCPDVPDDVSLWGCCCRSARSSTSTSTCGRCTVSRCREPAARQGPGADRHDVRT